MADHLKYLTVQTEPGSPDSLKESVKIALTITPAESHLLKHPYKPLATKVGDFRLDAATTTKINWWEKSYYFGTYSLTGRQAKLIGWSGPVPPGGTATLSSSGNWSNEAELKSGSVTAVNQFGSKQNVLLSNYLAYEPLDNGGHIVTPCGLNLQAYVVNEETQEWWILRPEDLSRPIFSTPINCDALPDNSTWILSQGSDGVIRLKNDEYSHLGYPPEKVAEEPSAVSAQQPQVIEPARVTQPQQTTQTTQTTQLAEVLQRLCVMEESISRIRDDVAMGQQAMAGMQRQISALETSAGKTNVEVSGLGSSILTIETEVAALNESFGQSQDRLSLVEKATTEMKQLLTGLDNTVKSTNEQVLDLNRRVPAVEAKCENTTLSLGRSLDRLSAVEKAASGTKNRVEAVEKSTSQTKEQVSLVQQLVVSTNNQLSLMKQIAGSATPPSSLPLQDQTADVDRRIPIVEAQVAKMEKSLSQTQKQLVSMRNTVNMMDRRLPIVETKTGKLEISLGQAQADIIVAQVSLADLDRRVAVMEARSGDADLGVDDEVGNLSSPSAQGSPFTFPSQSIESPPISRNSSPVNHVYPSR